MDIHIQEWQHNEYTISTDPTRLDTATIHQFLSTSYWAKGIPLETVQQAIEHSLNFGVYLGSKQVGYARVVTDYTTFAYIGDVFILPVYRGRGLSKWLMEKVAAHPNLQGLRRWMLLTHDAHGLYEKSGFQRPTSTERYMERAFPNIYLDARAKEQ
ncbi:GNAT family N-acetyltransferase [Ktedonospora formicarum]|uniref:N-acetyltransferase n=1 Tax=Ktedonospora formicarum TaxID=2778364 RepID=A0A8J3I0W6_9CHLR|nr:GNAT family N-acetyltransferase [Ktedonospora formicarum]GHO45541.1 N-acetyltransferase [Ktedonospora formicarum]